MSEVVSASDVHLKGIPGTIECTRLCRMEIPSSVELIDPNGFRQFISPNSIPFYIGWLSERYCWICGMRITLSNGNSFIGSNDHSPRRQAISSTRAVVFASEYASLIIYQAHCLQHLQPPIHLQVQIIKESIERPSAEAQISSRG
jgi:hypothetical protein